MNNVADHRALARSHGDCSPTVAAMARPQSRATTGSTLKKALAVALLVTVAGCSSGKWGFPYRAPTQQGNWVTAEQVALLRQGMTQDQVLYALGTPTLIDIFNPNRWDYPFYYKPGYGKAVNRNLSLWFVDGRLERWEGDPQPNYQPADFETQRTIPTADEDALMRADGSSSAASGQSSFQTIPYAGATE